MLAQGWSIAGLALAGGVALAGTALVLAIAERLVFWAVYFRRRDPDARGRASRGPSAGFASSPDPVARIAALVREDPETARRQAERLILTSRRWGILVQGATTVAGLLGLLAMFLYGAMGFRPGQWPLSFFEAARRGALFVPGFVGLALFMGGQGALGLFRTWAESLRIDLGLVWGEWLEAPLSAVRDLGASPSPRPSVAVAVSVAPSGTPLEAVPLPRGSYSVSGPGPASAPWGEPAPFKRRSFRARGRRSIPAPERLKSAAALVACLMVSGLLHGGLFYLAQRVQATQGSPAARDSDGVFFARLRQRIEEALPQIPAPAPRPEIAMAPAPPPPPPPPAPEPPAPAPAPAPVPAPEPAAPPPAATPPPPPPPASPPAAEPPPAPDKPLTERPKAKPAPEEPKEESAPPPPPPPAVKETKPPPAPEPAEPAAPPPSRTRLTEVPPAPAPAAPEAPEPPAAAPKGLSDPGPAAGPRPAAPEPAPAAAPPLSAPAPSVLGMGSPESLARGARESSDAPAPGGDHGAGDRGAEIGSTREYRKFLAREMKSGASEGQYVPNLRFGDNKPQENREIMRYFGMELIAYPKNQKYYIYIDPEQKLFSRSNDFSYIRGFSTRVIFRSSPYFDTLRQEAARKVGVDPESLVVAQLLKPSAAAYIGWKEGECARRAGVALADVESCDASFAKSPFGVWIVRIDRLLLRDGRTIPVEDFEWAKVSEPRGGDR